MDDFKLFSTNENENSMIIGDSNNVKVRKLSGNSNSSLTNHQIQFFDAIYLSTISEVKDYFHNLEFKPWEWIDEEGYTCLHKACFMNLSLIVNLIFECLKFRGVSELEIKTFINTGSLNKSRAIHFAAYRGNIEIIQILIENGADINAINDSGLNVLHMAAQGDQPSSLIYFREKYEFDLETRDYQDNSPLHWACYLGSSNFLSFYLSYNNNNFNTFNINIQEENGLSPLHLAVISEKTKIIKKLLHKGAERNIMDNKKRTPYTLALEKHKMTIVDILRDNKNSICDKDWLFKQSIEKPGKSQVNMLIFIILHILIETTTYLLIFPHFGGVSLNIIYILTFTILMFSFALLICSNPGYITHDQLKLNTKSQEESYKILLELVENKNSIDDYCPHCVVFKFDSNRSKHCYYCNQCIKGFDHHCYWVNNCIGVDNINMFLIFVSIVVFNLFLHIYIGFYGIFVKNIDNNHKVINNMSNFINIFHTDLSMENYFPPRFAMFDNFHLYDKYVKLLLCSTLLIISICFLIPISILLIKNIQNLIMRIKKKRKEDIKNSNTSNNLKSPSIKRNRGAYTSEKCEVESNNLLLEQNKTNY